MSRARSRRRVSSSFSASLASAVRGLGRGGGWNAQPRSSERRPLSRGSPGGTPLCLPPRAAAIGRSRSFRALSYSPCLESVVWCLSFMLESLKCFLCPFLSFLSSCYSHSVGVTPFVTGFQLLALRSSSFSSSLSGRRSFSGRSFKLTGSSRGQAQPTGSPQRPSSFLPASDLQRFFSILP